ncbi:MAG: hypothetical protein LBD88_04150 [Candidatus Peribacteria bacterium]|jgi:hypothetical protein|nr:hypothetical protein [Candidatus Peribacteria bacterium]
MTPNSATPKTSNRELKTFYLPSINNDVEICFYGLSLNQNDYSYYQALFDRYDIYNNKKIKIVFATKKEYEFELKDSVYELLKNYGKTLDNKDHGKNLITLLLLEKRLMFRIK